MTRKEAAARFCNYEHLGGCSDVLTHRVEYWVGDARRRLGPWAYFCSNHAAEASHLGLERLEPRHRNRKRCPKATVLGETPRESI